MNKRILLIGILLVIGAGAVGYSLRGADNNGSSSTTSTQTNSFKGKTANYSGKGLTEFPKEVLNQTNITVLNLANNNLTGALPSEIQKLINLVELNVSGNQMTGIPAEVGQLRHLQILNYANNQITGLPMELGKLTQLKILDLSGNNVSQLDLAGIKAKLTKTQIKL